MNAGRLRIAPVAPIKEWFINSSLLLGRPNLSAYLLLPNTPQLKVATCLLTKWSGGEDLALTAMSAWRFYILNSWLLTINSMCISG